MDAYLEYERVMRDEEYEEQAEEAEEDYVVDHV